ncbi:MAG: YggS family pyridoxal phosphate-dependent enzyme [Deltaproteobacteria bacterium]|nr:YggS family pyridoxal phosphate-dependent enzyme [Deltaproteobacteria bacterium]MBW2530181.1 YggS family pyridoxal phosphate-dependent enzyme [Deltaproteobacteria bacterium]
MARPDIAERLAAVRDRLGAAARAAGREPESIKLLAVSKRKPTEDVVAAYEAGQRDFGENYGQELLSKAAELSHLSDLNWHHIGHVQRNKVRQLVPHVHLLHAVDRPKLVAEIDKRSHAAERQTDVLVQVNIAGEDQKSGCAPGDLGQLLETIRACEHVRIRGLMTMPPYLDDPEQVRPYFRRLRELRDAHGGAAELPELSMGMSHDFAVAIEEGATIVRVGTAIFGARD